MRPTISFFALVWNIVTLRPALVLSASVGALAGVLLLAPAPSQAQTIQEKKLLASDGVAGDFFGESVATTGDVVLVGAPGDDDQGNRSGAAYVYRGAGTSWIEEEKLLPAGGAAEESFGQAVSISGNAALVGAPGTAASQVGDPGEAYVFRFDGSDWVEEAKLQAPGGSPGDFFGFSVAISGDVAVVGAHLDDESAPSAGAAHVFRFDGSSWVHEAKLLRCCAFGWSVSVDGDLIVAGLGPPGGAAYVFRHDGSGWVEEAMLVAPDEGIPPGLVVLEFGRSVSASGGRVLVGAPAESSGFEFRRAYIFERDGVGWNDGTSLGDGFSPVQSSQFGASVSIAGEEAVVGTPLDRSNGREAGTADLFRFDGMSWVAEAKFLPSEGSAFSHLGGSVSVAGDTAVAGAHGDPQNGVDAGAAYVFSDLQAPPACDNGLDDDGDGASDLEDAGCSGSLDTSERAATLACDDGRDNDGDGAVDTADIGCRDEGWPTESPECSDGIDNDQDELIDFDGGLSVLGYVATGPDPECVMPWEDVEKRPFQGQVGCGDGNPQCLGGHCGLGFELVLILPGLMWLHRRGREGSGPRLRWPGKYDAG